MYYECSVCKRVTNHKEIANPNNQSFSTRMGSLSPVYLICPLCDTGVAGNRVSVLGQSDFSRTTPR